METPQTRLITKLIINRYCSRSVSPIQRNINLNDNKFLKCETERLCKTFSISPLLNRSQNNHKWLYSSKQPDAKRSLTFDEVSPIKRGNVTALHVQRQNTICKNNIRYNIKYREHSDIENSLPSVDTPNRNSILTNGIGSNNIRSVIGYGSFGTVIRAKYKNKKVAVKVIPKDIYSRYNSIKSELNGVILKHPNIINVYKVVNNLHASYALVIMEFWYTTNMQLLIDCCPSIISFRQKVIYILGLCRALQYCHDNGVVHLDVKPKNILIGRYGPYDSCKICDFGSSIMIDESFQSNPFDDMHRQGTIKYMAPELLRDGTITNKADIFSLAITMWQLLHEETPYSGEHLHTIIYKVVSQNYRPKMYEANSQDEAVFVELYKMCWSEDPKTRPPISNIIKCLEELQILCIQI